MKEAPDKHPFESAQDQKKLLRIILNGTPGTSRILKYIDPGFFVTDQLRLIFEIILNYTEKYGKVPGEDWFARWVNSIRQENPVIAQIAEEVWATSSEDEGAYKDDFIEWVRQSQYCKSMREAIALWDSGTRNESIEKIAKDIFEVSSIKWADQEIVDPIESFELDIAQRRKRTQDGQTGAIATGVDQLDTILNGGLSLNELGLLIAPTGCGKTSILTAFGAYAAHQGHKTLHLMLEDVDENAKLGYQSWIMQMDPDDLARGEISDEKYQEFVTKWKPHYDNKLRIVRWDANDNHCVRDLQSLLNTMQNADGWRPEMIIVDYADRFKIGQGVSDNPWQEQAETFRQLKALAENGYAIWTATQLKTQDNNKGQTDVNYTYYSDQAAGSNEKLRCSSYVGTLNATNDERAQGRMRLCHQKYRSLSMANANARGTVATLCRINHRWNGPRAVGGPFGVDPV